MRFSDWVIAWALRRTPNRVIGTGYLSRWYLIPRNRLLNVYVHRFEGDDDDRALHDHPWWSLSLMLRGSLTEVTRVDAHVQGVFVWTPVPVGKWRLRSARFAHRLTLRGSAEAWTLFITGPVIRRWGFHCPNGWRYWRDFTDESGDGIGRGCD